MHDSLDDKVVLVTGAGAGIGRALAERFASVGSSVVVNDIEAPAAEAVASAIRAAGGTAIGVGADVSDGDAVAAMFERLVAEFGRIDVLVNNAGLVGPMLHFFDADEAWWRRIIDVNLTGHFLCARFGRARLMAKAGGGSIINMSSGGATKAHRAFTAYDASKGGIEALTRAMALDLGPYGIRVNALMPGSIDTSGLDLEQRTLRVNVPLGRIGEPHDMTGAALFLASDDAGYITGDVIRIDGGMLAQQRSATVDIMPPSGFPSIEDL